MNLTHQLSARFLGASQWVPLFWQPGQVVDTLNDFGLLDVVVEELEVAVVLPQEQIDFLSDFDACALLEGHILHQEAVENLWFALCVHNHCVSLDAGFSFLEIQLRNFCQ